MAYKGSELVSELRHRISRAYAAFVADAFSESMSPTCRLLKDAMELVELGNVPYSLREAAEHWMRESDTWVDKHVLRTLLRKDSVARVRNLVLVRTTRGWEDDFGLTHNNIGPTYDCDANAAKKQVSYREHK